MIVVGVVKKITI